MRTEGKSKSPKAESHKADWSFDYRQSHESQATEPHLEDGSVRPSGDDVESEHVQITAKG